MRTMKLLKCLIGSSIILLISNGLLAQTGEPYGDMVEVTDAVNQIDSVTGGVADSVPYYVEPDPILNSGWGSPYDPTAVPAGLQSTWQWSLGGGVGGTMEQGGGAGAADGPYITVKWDDPGTGDPSANEDTVWVSEVSTTGCQGDSSYVRVRVFQQPSYVPVIFDGEANDDSVNFCEGDAALTGLAINIDSIVDNYVSGGNLKITVDVQVDSVDPATLAPLGAAISSITDSVFTISEVGGDGNGDADVTLGNWDLTLSPTGAITRYIFDFGDSKLAAGNSNGITDHISRKTNYLVNQAAADANWTYFAPTDAGDGLYKVFYVYPRPETGNIFFIGNDFDL